MNKSNKSVVILGASFVNSGAESMTSIVVAEVKKRLPDCRIILGTTDTKIDRAIEVGGVIPYQFPTKNKWDRSLAGFIFRLKLGVSSDVQDRFSSVIKNAVAIIDISGYEFSTKFGMKSIYSYLFRIHIAKQLGIPYYIMPQSFGPIEYPGLLDKILSNILIRYYFKYPEFICVRERSGYKAMSGFGLKKLTYVPDMVLLYPDEIRSIKGAHKDNDASEFVLNDKKNVAIIPNQKIYEKTKNGNQYMELLGKYIETLSKNNFVVHIIAHCSLDEVLCKKLYLQFKDEKSVVYNGSSIDSETFLKIVGNMDFIVASRYHSIVHGYREGVPAIALGWEDKYNELLKLMGQTKYCVDCRERINMDYDIKLLEDMMKCFGDEQSKIKVRLKKVREKYGEYTKNSR